MSDDTYNGWKNYPTWAVNMWLGNDRGLYEATVEVAQTAIAAPAVLSDVWTAEESARYNVADALKAWVTDELAPDLGASFAADLLGYALELVDWNEIADAWIQTANDQVSS